MESLSKFTSIKDRVLYKALFCREFEKLVQELSKNKIIKCPIYLSIGQELVPAVISELIPEAKIFAQHRAHSYFLCFQGAPKELLNKLTNSKEGSASIQIKNKMFGHSGLMGDQAPIAVGAALGGISPVVCVLGDASTEEDYVLGSIGFASNKKLPVLFVVEDNNLSILTEKKVRRNWEISDLGNSFNLETSIQTSDNIDELIHNCKIAMKKLPALINVSVNRLCWHSGHNMNETQGFDMLYHCLGKHINEKEIIASVKQDIEKILK